MCPASRSTGKGRSGPTCRCPSDERRQDLGTTRRQTPAKMGGIAGETKMKATWNGAVLAESDDIVTLEGNHYFPESSLNRDYVTFSNHRTSCPWKGQAYYYTLFVNGEMNPEAVWYYPEPTEAAADIKGRVAFWKGVKVE